MLVEGCPINPEWLDNHRITHVEAVHGGSWKIQDQWYGNIQAHQSLPNLWTGQTIFHIKSQYEKQIPELQIANTCTEMVTAGQEMEIALKCGRA